MITAIVLLALAVLATAVSLTLFAVTAWRDRDSLHEPRPDALVNVQLQAVPKWKHRILSRLPVEPLSQQAADLRNIGMYVPILDYTDVSSTRGHEAIQSYQQELTQHSEYVPALEAMEGAAKRKGDLKQARLWHKKVMDWKRSNPASSK